MPETTRPAVLHAEDVTVVYPGRPPVVAVDGVSVTVHAGETVALVGESGSGKSSLGRALIGMEPVAGGTIEFDGRPVVPLGLRARAASDTAMQMVFQDPSTALNPRRPVGDQVRDGIRAAARRGVDVPDLPDLFGRVGLDPGSAGRRPREFSGGQQQRLVIARALAALPRLLIADEPISSLDASTQSSVADLMRRLVAEAGAGMLFISHDLSVVRRIADRVLVMYAGRIVEQGPTEQIWAAHRHPYTRALLGAIPVPDGEGRLPRAPSEEERATWREAAAFLD